jgi:hypothetical protein
MTMTDRTALDAKMLVGLVRVVTLSGHVVWAKPGGSDAPLFAHCATDDGGFAKLFWAKSRAAWAAKGAK